MAAFVAETVVGSTSGAVPPVDGYFRAMREVCDRHGVLLVLDEIMAGLGRTGRYFAYHDDGIVPDIAVVGKGLAAGYQPISAMLVQAHVRDALANGSGVLRNGQTHVNHPVAAAAALVVQRAIDEHDLLTQVTVRGRQLRARLEELTATTPYVGDVRGRGLLVGVELVADQTSKAALSTEFDFVDRMKAAGLAHGLLTYPGAGTIDGVHGHHVLFAPRSRAPRKKSTRWSIGSGTPWPPSSTARTGPFVMPSNTGPCDKRKERGRHDAHPPLDQEVPSTPPPGRFVDLPDVLIR